MPDFITEPVTIDRPISAGEEHAYRLALPDLEGWLVVLTEFGFDTALIVKSESAAPLTFDSPPGRIGVERVLLRDHERSAQLLVRSWRKGVAPGRYRLRIAHLDDIDTSRTAAFELEAQAKRLMAEAAGADKERAATLEEKALVAIAGASEHWAMLDDWNNAALALYASGYWHRVADDRRQALGLYRRTAAAWARVEHDYERSTVAKDIGRILLELGRYDDARSALGEAIELARRSGNSYVAATARNDFCLSHRFQGDVARAERCYLPIVDDLLDQGELWQASNTLANLAVAKAKLGKTSESLAIYRRAESILRELDNDWVAKMLTAQATLRLDVGLFQEALQDFSRARRVFEELGNAYWIGEALAREGEAYLHLGELKLAELTLTDALATQQRVGNAYGAASTMILLARLCTQTDRLDEAASQLEDALSVSRSIESHYLESRALLHVGQLAIRRGNFQNAESTLSEARLLSLREELKAQVALADLFLGEALQRQGKPREALAHLEGALEVFRRIDHKLGEARAMVAIARSMLSQGGRGGSLRMLEAALETIDALAVSLQSPTLQASFLGTHRDAYEQIVGVLANLYESTNHMRYLARSFEVAEHGRARALLAYLDDSNRGVLSAPQDPLQVERNRLRDQLSRAVSRSIRQPYTQRTSDGWREIWALSVELERLDDRLRRRAGGIRSLTAERVSTSQIQKLIDDGTLLLEYVLGEEMSHLWIVSSQRIEYRRLPPRSQLERLAFSAISLLRDENSNRSFQRDADLADLSELLLASVAERPGVSRLAIVPDGMLHRLPFAALLLPTEEAGARVPAVERFEIVRIPSAKSLWVQRRMRLMRPLQISRISVIADPAYGEFLSGLPGAREEAELIARRAEGKRTTTYVGPAAARDLFFDGSLATTDLIHVAAHGLSDAARPGRSGMTLSLVDSAGEPIDGFIGLRDVYDLRLRAGLVVLSGCDTAMGRFVTGDAPQGLGTAFHYAGVPRTISSLWRVPDRSTLVFMDRLYEAMLEESTTASAALRQAQLAVRGQRRLRHPVHWASFVLTGSWR